MSARRNRSASDEPKVTAREVADAKDAMSETVEGGRYRQPDGSYVNAKGEPLKDAKTTDDKSDD